MMHTLEFDNLKVTWIHYLPREYRMVREVFPDTPDEIFKENAPEGYVPSAFSNFLIDSNGTKILIDTGLSQPDTLLLEKLKTIDVKPEDINYIYISHFHDDHIGGLLNGDGVVFPNATVYIGEKEYENRFKHKDGSRIKFFKHGDILPCNVKAHDCSGHTPGHTVFEVGKVLLCTDMIHALALQRKHPEYCNMYDMDKESAIAKRKYFVNYAKENGMYIGCCHFPYPGFYQP